MRPPTQSPGSQLPTFSPNLKLALSLGGQGMPLTQNAKTLYTTPKSQQIREYISRKGLPYMTTALLASQGRQTIAPPKIADRITEKLDLELDFAKASARSHSPDASAYSPFADTLRTGLRLSAPRLAPRNRLRRKTTHADYAHREPAELRCRRSSRLVDFAAQRVAVARFERCRHSPAAKRTIRLAVIKRYGPFGNHRAADFRLHRRRPGTVQCCRPSNFHRRLRKRRNGCFAAGNALSRMFCGSGHVRQQNARGVLCFAELADVAVFFGFFGRRFFRVGERLPNDGTVLHGGHYGQRAGVRRRGTPNAGNAARPEPMDDANRLPSVNSVNTAVNSNSLSRVHADCNRHARSRARRSRW